MMMLQKYQFELRDCSHIFSYHKEVGILLAKKYKSNGHWSHQQWAPIRVATGERLPAFSVPP
jgi:hypothetical protein